MKTETNYNHCGNFSEKSNRTVFTIFLSIALIAVTLAVYVQVGNHPFVDLDDYYYIVSNPHVAGGITGENIIWAFTSLDSSTWQPITWLSHITDMQLYGTNPRGHHLTSVAIHSLTTALIFLFLFRSTGTMWPSYLVAALFALHPLHVESVAWIAERRDVLSAFFLFLTLFIYTGYVETQRKFDYALTIFFFVLGLMSKQMLVTLPLIMLLIDFWPLGRYIGVENQNRDQLLKKVKDHAKEKIPFFLCSILASAMTLLTNKNAGTIIDSSTVPFLFRIENALISYLKYIGKTVWPSDLAVLYPYPSSIPLWQSLGSLSIILLISTAAVRTIRKHPYFAVGWFWFIITLLPVIGLIQVGGQAMADRYSYISIIGLFIIFAWGVHDLTKGMQHQQRILTLLTGTLIIVSSALTWQQLRYWQSSISLFQHTLRVTTDNFNIHSFLGNTYKNSGNLDAAILEYQESLRIEPKPEYLYKILGMLAQKQRGDIQGYLQELQINPNDAKLHFNIGSTLEAIGYLDAAIFEYKEALRLDPTNKKAYDALENAFVRKRMQINTSNTAR